MSTALFEMKEPWSSIRIESEDPGHTRISVWQDGGHAGTLTVNTEKKMEAIHSFFNMNDFGCRTGLAAGTYLAINREPRSKIIMTEYSELLDWESFNSKYPRSPIPRLVQLVEESDECFRHSFKPPSLDKLVQRALTLFTVNSYDKDILKECENLANELDKELQAWNPK